MKEKFLSLKMKYKFLSLKMKYGHASLSDWDILHIVLKNGQEVYIYMHNVFLTEDEKSLHIGHEWNILLADIQELSSEPGEHWTSRD